MPSARKALTVRMKRSDPTHPEANRRWAALYAAKLQSLKALTTVLWTSRASSPP
jgi:hypothetical protein